MNIQHQFELWAKEDRAFRMAEARADKERVSLTAALQQARTLVTQLATETRKASDERGEHQGAMEKLKKEKALLQKQLTDERSMLEQCAEETKAMEVESKSAKISFCKEVEEMNNEVLHLITKQEENALQRLITVESVNQVFANTEHAELQNAIEKLNEASIQHEVVQQEIAIQRKLVAELRAIALQHHNPPLTENHLDELERMWEAQDNSMQQHSASEPVHNQLFYAGEQDHDENAP